MVELRPFQRTFIRRALAPGIDVAALSIPRGNGKSWLAAHLLQRALTPGDSLHVPGSEYLLCAASIEQARLVYRFHPRRAGTFRRVPLYRLGNEDRHPSPGQQHPSEGTFEQRKIGFWNCWDASFSGGRTWELGGRGRYSHV